MPGEHLHPEFKTGLAIGQYNESVISHEFLYQGVPIRRTQGEHPFDFFLPNGQSVEVKIDLRSQCTGMAAVEWPTLQRMADFYIYTLTYARVLTHKQLEYLYMHEGKLPVQGLGSAGYDGRLVRNLGKAGVPLWQFIKDLKQTIH